MNLLAIRLAAFLLAISRPFGQPAVGLQGPSTTLHGLARPGNDFAPDDDSIGTVVPVPRLVAVHIDSIARATYAESCSPVSSCGGLTLRDFYGPVFRIKAPKDRYLYVFHAPLPWGGWYHFILTDRLNHRIVTEPIRIVGRWMDRTLVRHPTLFFRDLDGDGSLEVVIEEAIHRGTDDTGWIYHYFSIDTLGVFHHVISVEWNWADDIVVRYVTDSTAAESEGVIKRTLRLLAPNRLRLDTSLERDGARSLHLGYAVLERQGPGAPFRVLERHPSRKRWNELLLCIGGVTAEIELLDWGSPE